MRLTAQQAVLVATLFHQGRTDMKLLKLNTSRLAMTGVLLAALAACGGTDIDPIVPQNSTVLSGVGSDTGSGTTVTAPAQVTPINVTQTVVTPSTGTSTAVTPTVTAPVVTPPVVTTPNIVTPTTVATPIVVEAPVLAALLLKRFDDSRLVAIPSTGAAVNEFSDGCNLNNGLTKAASIAAFDANLSEARARIAFSVGAMRTNLRVLAERNLTNPDGSKRREIDVSYQVNYADGSTDREVTTTLISGSSQGSCATPQVGEEARFLVTGNWSTLTCELRLPVQTSLSCGRLPGQCLLEQRLFTQQGLSPAQLE